MRKKLYRWTSRTTVLGLGMALMGCVPPAQQQAAEGGSAQATAPAIQPAPVAEKPAQAAAPAANDLRQRQVQVLIHQVEAAYARGEAAYKKGRLLEAKTEFDRAVDLMLESNIDIRTAPQLEEEFNHVIDKVNGLEMEALKQGNGFAPKEEPTPAEAAEDVTFEVDPTLVAKAKADLATTKSDLPLVVNDYVAAFINFFANTKKGHYTLLHSFQRSGRYKAMIEKAMAEEGVPQDLIYLAVAESGFNPRALNPHSHAGGMWQFMPYGNYGLKRDAYVDERFDPEKSTRAYARYMKFIYNQLGDWYLSMAGYDWGAGNVQRAVGKTGYADYWELYKRNNLPGETKNYVPEILAAIIIANHPEQYGFDDLTLDPPILTDTVTLNYSLDLRLASDIVGAPVDELRALNPSLLRSVTPPDASFDLHLPAGTALLYEKRIAAIPENKRNAWRYHRVTGDDTLASVAHDSHISVSELAEANQLKESDSLTGLEGVAVPAAPAPSVTTRALSYTARKGDTLVTIADRFGVSLTQLRQWNKLSGVKVEPGRKLRVTEPVATGHSSRSRRHGKSSSAQSDEPVSKSKAKSEKSDKSAARSTSKSGKHAASSEKKQSKDAAAAPEKKSGHRAKSSAPSEGKSTSHRSGKRAKSSSKKEK